MRWLGLDIGGANLKIADGEGYAASRPFALWKQPERLADELAALLAAAPSAERVVITMTGELCDCFPNKATGVRHIVEAAVAAVGSRPLCVYLTNGSFVAPSEAIEQPRLAAASNWHCLARFAGRFATHKRALLIDIGSTTCDIIRLKRGVPNTLGLTDSERIRAGELVYRGVERTPCCAVAMSVPYRNRMCVVAAELFATMRDVYLLLGDLPEAPDDCDTADSRPATKAFAAQRIARLVAADDTECDAAQALVMARYLAFRMKSRISQGINAVLAGRKNPKSVILSGHGEFVARRALRHCGIEAEIQSLSEQLGADIARCAPAHALAVLARENLP